MGGAFGVAIFGSILSNRLNDELPRLVNMEALGNISARALTASPERLRLLPPEVIAGIREAFANSLEPVFLLAVPLGAVAFVLALLLRDRPMRERPAAPTGGPAQVPTAVE
jgi:hypothetical protein